MLFAMSMENATGAHLDFFWGVATATAIMKANSFNTSSDLHCGSHWVASVNESLSRRKRLFFLFHFEVQQIHEAFSFVEDHAFARRY